MSVGRGGWLALFQREVFMALIIEYRFAPLTITWPKGRTLFKTLLPYSRKVLAMGNSCCQEGAWGAARDGHKHQWGCVRSGRGHDCLSEQQAREMWRVGGGCNLSIP